MELFLVGCSLNLDLFICILSKLPKIDCGHKDFSKFHPEILGNMMLS